MIKDKNTFVFDMDGTLAECREQPVYEKNKVLLQYLLSKGKNVLIVSAGNCKRILDQINATGALMGKIYIMGNYGLDCATLYNGKVIDEKKFYYKNEFDEKILDDMFNDFREKYGFKKFYGKSHVVFESGLIAFSLLGTDAPQEEKRSFDPDQSKRQYYIKKILKILPKNFTAHIAGQTSIDILKKTFEKDSTILNWALEHNCPVKDIIFFGNEITKPYGNDSSILNSGIDYIEVKDYKETAKHFAFLKKNDKEFNF